MELLEQLSISSKTGQSRVNAFVERYPEPGFMYLACHAAFPVALSSDLLYKIWLNFKNDESGESLDIPLEAVALLANSVLCRSIGNDLFEIYEDVRDDLQRALQSHTAFGTARLQHLAQFIIAYTDHCTNKIPNAAFKKALRWKAEAYLNPKKAALELIDLFADKTEKGENTEAIKVYLSWIKGHNFAQKEEGINYIGLAENVFEGVRQFQAGNMEAAEEVIKRIAPYIQEEENIVGQTPFKTRLPEGFLALMDIPATTKQEVIESKPVSLFAHDHARNKEIINRLYEIDLNNIEWSTSESSADYIIHFGQQVFYLALPEQPYQPLHRPLPFEQLEEAFQIFQYVIGILQLGGDASFESNISIKSQILRNGEWEDQQFENELLLLEIEDRFLLESLQFRLEIETFDESRRHTTFISGSNFYLAQSFNAPSPIKRIDSEGHIYLPFGNNGISLSLSQRAIDYNLLYEDYEIIILEADRPIPEMELSIPGLPQTIDLGNLQTSIDMQASRLPLLPEASYFSHHFTLRIKNPYYNLPDPERLKRLLANQLAEPFMRAIYFTSTTLHPQYQLKDKVKWDYRSPTQKVAADLQNLIDGNIYKPFVDGFEERIKSRLESESPLVIALGDSWYNQAQPVDITSQLTRHYTTVKALATTSSAESFLLRDIESEIQRYSDTPLIVLLSPFGKGLTHDLDDFVNNDTTDDGIRAIMEESFWELLEELKAARKARFETLADWDYEHMHFIIHGRDYFHMAAPENSNKAKALLYLVDHINEELKREVAAQNRSNLHFLDLRRTLSPEDWAYDFVPNEQGFQKLADKFHRFIDQRFEPMEDNINYKGSEYYTAQHIEVEINPETGMMGLMGLIGQESMKQQIRRHIAQLKANEGAKQEWLNMAFLGNPGTGKTTVARLLGQIYKEENILKRGHLVEVNKNDLISQYVGQTALLVKRQCEVALDGVLFIDEAYTLLDDPQGDFGREALDSLVENMYNYRDRLAVIFSGYPDGRLTALLDSNPALQRRIGTVIHFEDYTPQELYEIFFLKASKNSFKGSSTFVEVIKETITNISKNRDQNFGNAREIERLYAEIVTHYEQRHSTKNLEITDAILEPEDIPEKYKTTPIATEPELLQEKDIKVQEESNSFDLQADEISILINTLNRYEQISVYETAIDRQRDQQITTFIITGNIGEAHASLVDRIHLINREERGLIDTAKSLIKLKPEKNWNNLMANFWQAIYNAVGLDNIGNVNNTANLLRRVIKFGATYKIIAFQINVSEWSNALLDRFFTYFNEVFHLRSRGKNQEKERLQCFFLLEYEEGFLKNKLVKTLQQNFLSNNILPELQPVPIAEIEDWIKEHLDQGQYTELGGQMRLEGLMARYFSDGEAWPMEEAQYRLRQIMDNLTPEGDDPEQANFPEAEELGLDESTFSDMEIRNSLQIDDSFSSSKYRILLEKIKKLNITKHFLGNVDRVNCDRITHVKAFWNAFDANSDRVHQYYFIIGSPNQSPTGFTERMIYELDSELSERGLFIFYEITPSDRIRVDKLPIGRNLNQSQERFKRYFIERLHLNLSFEESLNTALPKHDYIVFTFDIYLNEVITRSKWIQDYIQWIIDTFNNINDNAPRFIFFFTIYSDKNTWEDFSSVEKSTLKLIKELSDKNQEAVLFPALKPVDVNSLKEWMSHIGEYELDTQEEIINTFVESLPIEKIELFQKEKILDMIDVERLQELILQVHLET